MPEEKADFQRGAVGIIFYNNLKFCEECIASLEAHLPKDVAIVAVDNGSKTDLAADLRPRYPHVHVVRVEKNNGAPGGLNAACDYGFGHGAPRVYLMNDDAVAMPGFWEACEAEMLAHGPGIVASIPLDFAPPHRIQYAGIEIDPKTFNFEWRAEGRIHDGSLEAFHRSAVVGGVGFMVSKETWETIGRFNETFVYLFEDMDYCLRAREAGHVVGTAGRSTILHHGSTTMVSGSPRFYYMLLRNNLWLARMYMPRRAYLRTGWFFVVRKAIFFVRTRATVRKSFTYLMALGRGIFDGTFGNPKTSQVPAAYR